MMDLHPILKVGIPRNIIQLPNLKFFEIDFMVRGKTLLNIPFNIGDKSDLNDLNRFAIKLGKPRNLNKVIESLPIQISTMIFNSMVVDNHLDHFSNLTYISLEMVELKSIKYLPKSLQHFKMISSRFKGGLDRFSWPPNMDTIYIEGTPMNDADLVKLSQWPNYLTSLALIGTGFEKYASLGILPPNLVYLNVTGKSNKIDPLINDQGHYSFPESIKHLKISGVNFFDYPDCEIQFSPRLDTLQISKCFETLKWQTFPTSLTHLHYCPVSGKDNLLEYNNAFLNKHWQQLINLTHLRLEKVGHSELSDWLPPKNLKYLDVSDTIIRSLDMAMFKEENMQYTMNLRKLDFSYSAIRSIPSEFYLPENMYRFILTGDSIDLNLFPMILRHKVLNRIRKTKGRYF
ncbi:hypothetical protein DFJ63DRAFT_311502 [Scheffersomyces coipomensis]|uniref:uncharacterized protein n=1 Tax=Scheffersomyces coipomensis TaxID=1788519 RepID=UPI00315DDD75